MTVCDRSSPSSLKIRCWSRPVRLAGKVWVQIGTPVFRAARAALRSTRSFIACIAGSVAHSMTPARIPAVLTHEEVKGVLRVIDTGSGHDLHARAPGGFGN